MTTTMFMLCKEKEMLQKCLKNKYLKNSLLFLKLNKIKDRAICDV